MHVPTPAGFMEWRKALRAASFTARGTGGRRGAYMARRIGPRTQAVGIMEHPRRPGEYNVQLNILADLPFAEPPIEIVILLGDLGRDRVVSEHNDYATWWQESENEIAWQRMVESGFGWLERHSTAEGLIDFYRTALEQGLPPAPEWPARGSGFLARAIAEIKTPPPPPPLKAPMDYHMWLAVLYEEVGDLERARLHAVEHFRHFRNRTSPEERGRMERHLEALGCSATVSPARTLR